MYNLEYSSTSAYIPAYYSALTAYIKSLGYTTDFGNSGTDIPYYFMGSVTTIGYFENSHLPALSIRGGWHSNYTKSNFAFFVYDQTSIESLLRRSGLRLRRVALHHERGQAFSLRVAPPLLRPARLGALVPGPRDRGDADAERDLRGPGIPGDGRPAGRDEHHGPCPGHVPGHLRVEGHGHREGRRGVRTSTTGAAGARRGRSASRPSRPRPSSRIRARRARTPRW